MQFAPASKAKIIMSPDNPRMQEEMRLMEAFTAIEDAQARAELIKLAKRLVSCDWARKEWQR
jgi:hypothetical protein